MNELTIITHLGLGDLILQAGLAVHFTKTYSKVYLPCRKRDYNSVRSFFLLQPKIEVVPLDTDSPHPEYRGIKQGSDPLMLGFYSPQGMDKGISFAENFYRQAGVNYDVRWDECPIQEVVENFYGINCRLPWFDFIHEDRQRGFYIKPFHCAEEEDNLIRAGHSASSMLMYAPFVEDATEVHVIDGPFLHLAESIETKGELFYHKYARPLSARWNDIDCPTRKKWTIL